MSFLNYFDGMRRSLHHSRPGTRRGPARRRPQLETLEERMLPTVDFSALATGLDSRLGLVQTALGTIKDTANVLPILNQPLSKLDGVQSVIKSFRGTLHDAIAKTDAKKVQSDIAAALIKINVLGDVNGDGVGPDDVMVHFTRDDKGVAHAVAVKLKLVSQLTLSAAPLSFGLVGLRGLPFQADVSGNVQVRSNFTFDNLEFGIDDAGKITFGKSKLEIDFVVGLDKASFTGSLGFLHFSATDQGSKFDPNFSMDMTGGDTPGLTNFRLTGQADAKLALEAKFDGGAGLKFPSFKTGFQMHWDFGASDKPSDPTGASESFGQAPAVTFTDVQMDLGSFLSDLAAPVLRKVQLVTGSVQPILDVLNARVPGLSDIGFGDITLKDLAKLAAKIPGALPPDIDALINLTATVADIVSTINKVDVKDKAVSIPFGDFEVGGDKGKNLRSLPTPTVPGDLTDLIPNVLKGFSLEDLKKIVKKIPGGSELLDRFFPDKANGVQFTFPIIEDPVASVFKVLLGRDADLFTFSAHVHMNSAAPDTSASLFGITAGIEGSMQPDLDLVLGYDTRGLRHFIKDKVAKELLDGFYLDTVTHFHVDGALNAVLRGKGSVYEATLKGGLNGILDVALHNPDKEPKLHYDQIKDCLFDTSGSLDIKLSFEIKVGVTVLGKFFGISHTFDILSTTFKDLSSGCLGNPLKPPDDPGLAFKVGSDALFLSMGPFFLKRKVEPAEINEDFTISHADPLSSDGPGEAVYVSAFGYTQRFAGVRRIYADGGGGIDTIRIGETVVADAELHHNGSGSVHYTYLGHGHALLSAEKGDAVLTGGAGRNDLYAGAGASQLNGGSGPNFLHGGTSTKFALGGGYDDLLVGGIGPNEIHAGLGRDKLSAGPAKDKLWGGPGGNEFIAGTGPDTMRMGAGQNTIRWQVGDGNVVIDGSLGNNTLEMIGSDAADVFTVSPLAKGVRVATPSRTVRGTGIRHLYIDGGKGADSITVNNLLGTSIQDVGLNLGELADPDMAKDKIVVNMATGPNDIAVDKETVELSPHGELGGITKVSRREYSVRAANVDDSLTVNTFGGNDTIRVHGITGPTTVNSGAGNDTIIVGNAGDTLADILGPLTINGEAGVDALTINDQGTTTAQEYTVTNRVVTRSGLDPITYGTVESLALNTGNAANTVKVLSTHLGTPLTLTAGGSNEVVIVGNTVNGVQGILGSVTVLNPANFSKLEVDDSADASPRSATLSVDGSGIGTIAKLAPAPIRYQENDLSELIIAGGSGGNTFTVANTGLGSFPMVTTLNTGSGDDTVNVLASTGDLLINTQGGNDTINVGSLTNALDFIQGALGIDGGSGIDAINLNDQGGATLFPTYAITSSSVDRTGAATITYSNVESLSIKGSASGGSFFDVFSTAAGTPVTLGGDSAGANVLGGQNGDNTWQITGVNAGSLAGTVIQGMVTFSSVQSLQGSAIGDDTFRFSDAQGVTGNIDGQGGVNSLDYSAYTSNVVVDLNPALNSATGVGSSVFNIQNVIGGNAGPAGSYNILVGNGGNVLTGGNGRRNLLIAGATSSTLQGGDDEDILIAGTTAFDADPAALLAIITEWTRTDLSYQERVRHILEGGGLNGVIALNPSTVTNNGGGNKLLGKIGLDLFYANLALFDVTDAGEGELVVTV